MKCLIMPEMCGGLAAEYPQSGIDAAVKDFAAVAGKVNAQLLADFLAQALQPQPGGDAAAAAAAGTPAGADGAEAAPSAVASGATAADSGVPHSASAVEASVTEPAGAPGAAEKEKKPFIRVQRNFLLQPVSDKARDSPS